MSANNESGFNGVVSVSNRAGMSYWACQNMFVRMAGVNQLFHDKRFEKLKRHLFGQATLMKLQFRSDHDYGTTGVINPFPQQVLTETTLFPFQHVTQRF